MRSFTHRSFWEAYQQLPTYIQRQARNARAIRLSPIPNVMAAENGNPEALRYNVRYGTRLFPEAKTSEYRIIERP